MAAIEARPGFKRLVLTSVGVAGLMFAAHAQAQTTQQSPVEVLHQALQLTPSQEGAWQVYRSASDIPEQAQARRRAASGLFRTLDSPHRMDLVEAEMQQELIDLQRQSRALKAFYGVLTPAQRAIFDARTMPPAGDTSQY